VSGLIEKPDPPTSSECCEGGCYPCVWDIYYAQLKQWKEQQEVLKQSLSGQQPTDENSA
jgi:cytochrome-b5 reductase